MEGLPSNEISDLTNWQMPVIRKSSSLGPEFQAFFLLFPDPILSIIDKLKNCMLSVQQDIGYQAPFGWQPRCIGLIRKRATTDGTTEVQNAHAWRGNERTR